ncbi:MAG: sensor histidine kinase [Aquabacterium sp.]
MTQGRDASAPPQTAPGDPLAASGPWVLGLLLLLPLILTALLHALLLQVPASAGGALRTFVGVERVDDASLHPPAGPGRPGRLPLFETLPAKGRAQPFWLLARFDLAADEDSTWLLEIAHRTSILVYLDGRLLAHSVPIDEADLPPRNLVLGNQRLVASVPPDWLGRGPHILAVRVGAPGPSGTSLGGIRLGPAPEMQAADAARRGWLSLRTATALGALVVGLFLLSAWLVNRQERLYLGAALYLMLLALLLSPYLLAEPPLPVPWWRLVLDVADVASKALLVGIVVASSGSSWGWARRLAWGYAVIAIPVDALAAHARLPWTDFDHLWPWWALGSRLAMLGLAVALAARAWLDRPGAQRAVTLVLCGLSLWVWCDVSFFALVWPGRVGVLDLNVVAYAGWALWVGALMHRRLLDTRRRDAELRDELASRLQQRTDELQHQFAALQASENARMAAQEREHLLQEMHDGLGAQLTAAKMLAGDASQGRETVVRALEDCIRELRLAVDALSVTDGDLGLLLGSLRHRLEPGLVAAGVALQWRLVATPHLAVLKGSQARELARIVQEALANVIHHAGAGRIRVATTQDDAAGVLRLSIEDDGSGMDPARPPGRGLRNMRTRAQRLSAAIRWLPGEDGRGTRLEVDLPLDDARHQP